MIWVRRWWHHLTQFLAQPMVRMAVFLGGLLVLGLWGSLTVLARWYPPQSSSNTAETEGMTTSDLWQLLTTTTTTPAPIRPKPQQWLDCADVRRVLTDTSRKYIGCRGGVLITDLQGKILQQYTPADGLTNDIVTDLAVVDTWLLVGTQDGLNAIELQTGAIKTIQVKDGLVNGSNLSLAVDGSTVWVGTFNGVSRIDIKTWQITNYTSELSEGSEIYNVHRIVVTPKAVYIVLIGSAHTQSGVARFDKKSQTFTRWPAQRFFPKVGSGELASLNYLNIVAIGETLLLQDGENFWTATDMVAPTIKALPRMTNTFSSLVRANDISGTELLGAINSQAVIRFFAQNQEHLALYTPKSKEVRVVVAQDPAFGLVQALSLARPSYQQSLAALAPNATRPFGFGQLLAQVGDMVWLTAEDGIWTLQPETGSFIKRLDWATDSGEPAQVWAIPLPNTNRVLVGKQVCGMGCVQPEVWVVSLPDFQFQQVPIPEDILPHFRYGTGEFEALDFVQLSEPRVDTTLQRVVFEMLPNPVAVDLVLQQWHILDQPALSPPMATRQVRCHVQHNWDESTATIQVTPEVCPNQVGVFRLGDYAQKVEFGEASADDWLSDGAGKKLGEIPAGLPIYSPFEQWSDPVRVGVAQSQSGRLWLGHTRGLSFYDPKLQQFGLLTASAGLVGPIVEDLVVLPNWLVVLSRGGLASIPLRSDTSVTP